MSNMMMEARMEALEKCVHSLRSETAKINLRLDGKIEEKLDKITEMLASLLHSADQPAAAVGSSGKKNGARRAEFPCFKGGDPVAWISQAERYFHLHETEEAAKVEVALGGMDGAGLNWVEWVIGRRAGISWKELKEEIVCVYGESPMVSAFEGLLGTKQTGSVDEYLNAFVSRALHVKGLSESHCLGVFLHGLHGDIRARIRSKDAKDILGTMYLARQIERELLFTQSLGDSGWD